MMLGQSLHDGLAGTLPDWPADRELGSIAGNLRLGLGLFIPGTPTPNDGSVAVQETRLEGMCDHIEIRTSHFGLLLSKKAALQTDYFLHHGYFLKQEPAPSRHQPSTADH